MRERLARAVAVMTCAAILITSVDLAAYAFSDNEIVEAGGSLEDAQNVEENIDEVSDDSITETVENVATDAVTENIWEGGYRNP